MATNPIQQLKSLQTKLQSEREERRRIEEEACEKLKGYKEQFDVQLKEKDDLIHSLQEQVKANFQSVSNEPSKQDTFDDKGSEDKENDHEIQAKRSRLESPSKDVSKLKQEIDDQKKLINDLKSKLESKTKDLELSEKNGRIRKEINVDLRSKNDELIKELNEMKEKLVQEKKEWEEKMKEKEESRAKIEFEGLKLKLKDESKKKDKLMEDISSLRKIIAIKESKIEEKDTLIKELSFKKENEAKQEDEGKKELEKELEKEMEKRQKAIDTLKKVCRESGQQADDFARLLEKKSIENERLISQLSKTEKELIKTKEEVIKTKEEVIKTKRDLSSKEEDRAKIDLEMKEKEMIISSLEQLVKEEQEKVILLMNELKEVRIANEELITKCQQLEEEIISGRNELMTEIAQLNEHLRDAKEERSVHFTHFLEEKGRSKSLKCELEERDRIIIAKNSLIDSLNEEIKSVIKEMEEVKTKSEREVFKLKEALRQHQQVEEEMMDRIQKLEMKKKPLIGINSPAVSFGSRSGAPTTARGSKSESEVDYKLINYKLQEKLNETRSELFNLKMELKLTQVERASEDTSSVSSPDYRAYSRVDNDIASTSSSSDHHYH